MFKRLTLYHQPENSNAEVMGRDWHMYMFLTVILMLKQDSKPVL